MTATGRYFASLCFHHSSAFSWHAVLGWRMYSAISSAAVNSVGWESSCSSASSRAGGDTSYSLGHLTSGLTTLLNYSYSSGAGTGNLILSFTAFVIGPMPILSDIGKYHRIPNTGVVWTLVRSETNTPRPLHSSTGEDLLKCWHTRFFVIGHCTLWYRLWHELVNFLKYFHVQLLSLVLHDWLRIWQQKLIPRRMQKL